MIIEYAMTEIIKEDIKTWQKTEGIKTIYEIGAKEDFSIIDFGCGDGRFTIAEAFACPKGNVFGVDIDSNALEFLDSKAKEYGLKNIKTVLANNVLSFENNSIDMITMNDLIHDIKDTYKLLKEFKQKLKPNGILAITPFHLSKDEIEKMILDIVGYGYTLNNTVKNGGIHFGRITKVNGAWKRLSDFERIDIYCFRS